MSRKILSFIALAITMLYGVGFAAFDTPRGYAVIGAVVVALSWIAVGRFGHDDEAPPQAPPADGAATPSSPALPPNDPTVTQSNPWGTPPTTQDAPRADDR